MLFSVGAVVAWLKSEWLVFATSSNLTDANLDRAGFIPRLPGESTENASGVRNRDQAANRFPPVIPAHMRDRHYHGKRLSLRFTPVR